LYERSTLTLTLGETLISVWKQVPVEGMAVVELEGGRYAVDRTHAKRLRTVSFVYEARRLDGIEQNPETGSCWAELAREGKRIMRFSYQHRYVANVCEGTLTRYPARHALRLPVTSGF
jgi:hypothetical protein